MARAARERTTPSASTGYGSAGGSSRMSWRGGSALISGAAATIEATASRDMADFRSGCAVVQNIRHIGADFGGHCNTDSPLLVNPPSRGIVCGAFPRATRIMIGTYDDVCCLWRQR